MASTTLLLAFTFAAALTDLLHHKIYNWTTYPGIVAALTVNTVESGWIGLEESLKGFVVCGLLMLLCLALFDIGGGDVKLVAMVSAFLGLQRGFDALLWTFVIGGAAGLVVLIWRVGIVNLVRSSVRHVALSLRIARWLPLSEEERKQLQPPLYLAPAAACAVVIVCFNLVK